jgi:tetratricopeptide (TPR) repeat protein
MQAWVLNSKGIGLYETGQKNEACSLFKQALSYDSGNSIFKMNISITNHSMGKRSDAITTGKQTVKQDPNNPRLWNVLGYLYLSTGRTENAIESIKRAQFIEPDNILTNYLLAICYYKDGQVDTCAEEIRKIQKFSKEHDIVQGACISIMTGKTNEAYMHLKQSIEKGQILKQQILRDPNLQILLKPYENMIFN